MNINSSSGLVSGPPFVFNGFIAEAEFLEESVAAVDKPSKIKPTPGNCQNQDQLRLLFLLPVNDTLKTADSCGVCHSFSMSASFIQIFAWSFLC